ncbi:TPA_exp: Uncharacterized protein A8136_1553 [Trichophyton benhamiae CBS 112371]|uniref:Uncharacterized protein n=2 Tax=Trichophyton TaxID=5550 RepID=D4AWK1_ARTBC|nr:uncharacterized protein ARB_00567 [Trichophyton benhamiae CBS 112371]XP_003022576.1 uncharacterized protein TRV_03297 [Trichophyton verrucosum HKI 0517]EFE32382.1 conserved hypothetical protein [Trichophyton benhamiae CBS 112371]EFE41958.1 conserved hypothetical protein [Trichophyton verrucosum HKI 0517]DAA75479.1 TPA_exp: Uncharacterized protein A8136_1553 [Trichophyton benhamiae CBS 112371]
MPDRPPFLAQATTQSTSSSVPSLSTSTTCSGNSDTSKTPLHSSSLPHFFHRHSRGSSLGGTTSPPTASSHLEPPTSPSRGHFFSSFSHSRSRSQSRPKSPAPAPIDTSTSHHLTHGGQQTTSPTHMVSPELNTPDSAADECQKKKRHSRKSSSSNHKRRSSTMTQVGRHGNDWLFNGFSVRDHVGKFLDHDK